MSREPAHSDTELLSTPPRRRGRRKAVEAESTVKSSVNDRERAKASCVRAHVETTQRIFGSIDAKLQAREFIEAAQARSQKLTHEALLRERRQRLNIPEPASLEGGGDQTDGSEEVLPRASPQTLRRVAIEHTLALLVDESAQFDASRYSDLFVCTDYIPDDHLRARVHALSADYRARSYESLEQLQHAYADWLGYLDLLPHALFERWIKTHYLRDIWLPFQWALSSKATTASKFHTGTSECDAAVRPFAALFGTPHAHRVSFSSLKDAGTLCFVLYTCEAKFTRRCDWHVEASSIFVNCFFCLTPQLLRTYSTRGLSDAAASSSDD